ncbi:hypothetical protein [Mycobacterium riyadhense]|uniref:hypothetical protein n=1 Tax=Mycobacterium riyadhense TaxID=486698 RepID=UPI00195E59AA|nr:hypothetical protein [Mycobacterium riyadhense]
MAGSGGIAGAGLSQSLRIAAWTAKRCAATWRPPKWPVCAVTTTSLLVDEALIGLVAEAVRPVRPDGHGAAREQLLGFEE